jgi:hypothetical protein
VCGKAFAGEIEMDHVPGLMPPKDIVTFAGLKDDEMHLLVNALRTRMTLAGARKFRDQRFDPKGEPLPLDESWTVREFLALMGPRKELTRVVKTSIGVYAWTMELLPHRLR